MRQLDVWSRRHTLDPRTGNRLSRRVKNQSKYDHDRRLHQRQSRLRGKSVGLAQAADAPQRHARNFRAQRRWNQGVATKMIEQMIELAKASEFIEIVNLRVREDNYPAIHLYEKLGFFHTGRVYKEIQVNGSYYDTLIMSLDLSKIA
ncbi:MAG: GNAT family N-acetyltransferase [Bacillus subtilis]|nr:GNAT family N-acetyltransferase [Bacillus subtilis]